MKLFFAFIILFAIACSSIFGLMNSDNESFIQGKWQIAGESISDKSLKNTKLIEWKFENGKFSQKGTLPIIKKGRYKILEDHHNILKLKLYNQKGKIGEKSSELEIVVDKKNKRLIIDGKGEFAKTINKSV